METLPKSDYEEDGERDQPSEYNSVPLAISSSHSCSTLSIYLHLLTVSSPSLSFVRLPLPRAGPCPRVSERLGDYPNRIGLGVLVGLT